MSIHLNPLNSKTYKKKYIRKTNTGLARDTIKSKNPNSIITKIDNYYMPLWI